MIWENQRDILFNGESKLPSYIMAFHIKEYSSMMMEGFMEAFCVLVVTSYKTVAAIAKPKELVGDPCRLSFLCN